MEPGNLNFFLSIWIKFFFLFTPPFALTMFLSVTRAYTEHQRRKLSIRISIAVVIVCLFLFFFGNIIFKVFGITLDAFRVGAGALLFLSAVRLVKTGQKVLPPEEDEDIAVVPLAIPVIVGPATIGTLLVLGGEIPNVGQRTLGCIALVIAVACLGLILLLGSAIERAIGKRGINILSKITGLILAALAAQMILTGIRNFFFQGY